MAERINECILILEPQEERELIFFRCRLLCDCCYKARLSNYRVASPASEVVIQEREERASFRFSQTRRHHRVSVDPLNTVNRTSGVSKVLLFPSELQLLSMGSFISVLMETRCRAIIKWRRE